MGSRACDEGSGLTTASVLEGGFPPALHQDLGAGTDHCGVQLPAQ